jgi:hypothetical protein
MAERHDSSITWFKENLLKNGLYRPNRFLVSFSHPAPSEVEFEPEAVTLPGRSFVTITEQYFGPPRNVPVSNVFDNSVVMTFFVDENQSQRTFFEKWMQQMVSDENYSQGFGADLINRSPVIINTLTINGEVSSTYRLKEAFPTAIFPMNLGQEMRDAYGRIQVQFSYTSYTYESAIPDPTT